MTVPQWIYDAVFYQIFPDRFYNGNTANDPSNCISWEGTPTQNNFFGGDLQGIINKLDYIQEIGCNALYLNPIFHASSNHKYDTIDYFTIDPAFGSDRTFDTLIEEVHRRKMHIVLDGVFNHCGDKFAPFMEAARTGPKSEYWDWFDFYNYPVIKEPEANYATCGGAGYLPRLNTENSAVEQFIHSVALHWLERGIDGWRLDVPYEISPSFWQRFRKTVKTKYPEAYLVAEEWRDASHFLQGDTFDGAMHYELRNLAMDFIIKDALTAEAFSRSLENLWKKMPSKFEFGMLMLLGSHDTPRIITECGGDIQKVILLLAIMLTLPGIPMIYYGDENGMTGNNDPDCRKPMIWKKRQWNTAIRKTVCELTALRHQLPCLRYGSLRHIYANDRIFVYERYWENERILIFINNSRVQRHITLPLPYNDNLFLSDTQTSEVHHINKGKITLNAVLPRSFHIFKICCK
ncbi:MAG: alpha-amlyase [Acidobacteria bacterium]|nr:MAG: alpha-amlyase [Acidobacteriota bacterium]